MSQLPVFEETDRPSPLFKDWLGHAADRWVGWVERRRKGLPSPRAWSEMLDYYAGLYRERAPDPAAFKRLLKRCGLPVCHNPFPEGEAEHFLYHPDLLVMADLESLLDDLVTSWQEKEVASGGEAKVPPTLEAFEWPDVNQAMQLRELEISRQAREWSRLAGICWGLALLDGQPLTALFSAVHKGNLGLATIHAWKTAPWADWNIDPAAVLNAAERHGILASDEVQHLLAPGNDENALSE